jgi:hypothetical protein
MPSHPDKHIRAAIEYLEAKDWKIETSGGHAWGRAFCPGGSDGCRPPTSIWSMPRSPEDHAKDLRKRADQCLHRLGTNIEKGV